MVTVCGSEDEFQSLAMKLAARVLLPGTGWIAFTQLMDLVGLMMESFFDPTIDIVKTVKSQA